MVQIHVVLMFIISIGIARYTVRECFILFLWTNIRHRNENLLKWDLSIESNIYRYLSCRFLLLGRRLLFCNKKYFFARKTYFERSLYQVLR